MQQKQQQRDERTENKEPLMSIHPCTHAGSRRKKLLNCSSSALGRLYPLHKTKNKNKTENKNKNNTPPPKKKRTRRKTRTRILMSMHALRTRKDVYAGPDQVSKRGGGGGGFQNLAGVQGPPRLGGLGGKVPRSREQLAFER